MEIRKCRDYKCRKGVVETDNPVSIRTGCTSFTPAYPCNLCGRLHWNDGSPVCNRRGHRAFYKDDQLFNLDRKGKKDIIS